MKPKISIVVPVYNVEQYLEQCLFQIMNQTYTNLEIILVDDGATDNSGSICDDFAKKDERIKVIHKENGGLSDARNVGMKHATGEYIGFIDSDDYPEITMYEKLYKLIEKYNVDISICGKYRDTNLKKEIYKEELLSRRNVFEEMARVGKIESHAWNKLYRRNLFDGIEYPVGKTYEDIYTTYKIIEKVDEVAYTSEQLYFYRDNPESISNQKFKESDLYLIYASIEFGKFLEERYPELSKYQSNATTRNRISVLRKILISGYKNSEVENFLIEGIRKNFISYLWSPFKITNKCFGLAVIINFKAVRVIWNILKKLKEK